MSIIIKRFDKTLQLPEYEPGAACFDLSCRLDITVNPKEVKLIPVNIAVKVPEDHALLIFARSSTPWKRGLMLANGVGVVDPFYCGNKDEVQIEVFNFGEETVQIVKGDKLAQAMFVKVAPAYWNEVDSMPDEGRGGYSTDK